MSDKKEFVSPEPIVKKKAESGVPVFTEKQLEILKKCGVSDGVIERVRDKGANEENRDKAIKKI